MKSAFFKTVLISLGVILSLVLAQSVNSEVNLSLQVNENYIFDLSSAYPGCAESINWNTISKS